MAVPELYNQVMALAKRRGFLWASFDIYGGTAGFYDYGPLGTRLKLNIEDVWRKYFVHGEGLQEIQSTHISPEPVFKASGHLDEFTDLMVECKKCGEPFRGDHLMEGIVDNAESMSSEELDGAIKEHKVHCPECGGDLTGAEPFNLMFRTTIGPGGKRVGFLRPETAQGMFINFQHLLRFNRGKLPFGVAQIGTVFRNEISPRKGILRVREFNQAEAEIFVDPKDKTHPKFNDVANQVLRILPSNGEAATMEISKIIENGIVKSKMLAYYMVLTHKYLVETGIDPDKIRFRQHDKDEMAHYADDCWDLEAQTAFGWTELVGIADRTCFDLQAHSKHAGEDLTVFVPFDEPKMVEVEKVVAVPSVLGPLFKGDAKRIKEAVDGLDPGNIEPGKPVKINLLGKTYEIPANGYIIEKKMEKVSGERISPHVIEPSFGIDRIIYTLIEHSYIATEKEGEPYVVLKLKPSIAPVKAGVFPLMPKNGLSEIAIGIFEALKMRGIMCVFDEGGSIGKRYARMDEIGTPWSITVDYESKDDKKATIRDRDSTDQIRVEIDRIPDTVLELLAGKSFKELK
jgi:glycyl-tRNA synthetase